MQSSVICSNFGQSLHFVLFARLTSGQVPGWAFCQFSPSMLADTDKSRSNWLPHLVIYSSNHLQHLSMTEGDLDLINPHHSTIRFKTLHIYIGHDLHHYVSGILITYATYSWIQCIAESQLQCLIGNLTFLSLAIIRGNLMLGALLLDQSHSECNWSRKFPPISRG